MQLTSKDRANGLYGPTAFMLANFIIGLPYLCLFPSHGVAASNKANGLPVFITVLFSFIAYWLSNFRPAATTFFTWIMWLFLDLVAAESLVVLVSSIFPNFVVSLPYCLRERLVDVGKRFHGPPNLLNVFWKYVFHYIDYQVISPPQYCGGLTTYDNRPTSSKE